jgi:hypothetical protein
MIHDQTPSTSSRVPQVLIAYHTGRGERVVKLGGRHDMLRRCIGVDTHRQLLGLVRLHLMIQELLRRLI